MHHSSTSTYIPNFIEIEETFCGRTDGRRDGRTDGRTYGRTFFPLSNIIRSIFGSRPKKAEVNTVNNLLLVVQLALRLTAHSNNATLSE